MLLNTTDRGLIEGNTHGALVLKKEREQLVSLKELIFSSFMNDPFAMIHQALNRYETLVKVQPKDRADNLTQFEINWLEKTEIVMNTKKNSDLLKVLKEFVGSC